jgi:preprotein translocase subunit Sec63
MWPHNSILLQLPHMTEDIIKRCAAKNITRIEDLIDLSDEDRSELLSALSDDQLADLAKVCNKYPDLDVEYSLSSDYDDQLPKPSASHQKGDDPKKFYAAAGKPLRLTVQLTKNENEEDEEMNGQEEDDDKLFVSAPFYPKVISSSSPTPFLNGGS